VIQTLLAWFQTAMTANDGNQDKKKVLDGTDKRKQFYDTMTKILDGDEQVLDSERKRKQFHDTMVKVLNGDEDSELKRLSLRLRELQSYNKDEDKDRELNALGWRLRKLVSERKLDSELALCVGYERGVGSIFRFQEERKLFALAIKNLGIAIEKGHSMNGGKEKDTNEKQKQLGDMLPEVWPGGRKRQRLESQDE